MDYLSLYVSILGLIVSSIELGINVYTLKKDRQTLN